MAFSCDVLVRALVAQGELSQARAILEHTRRALPIGLPRYIYADAEITLLLARGQVEEALERVWTAKLDCEAIDLRNPVYCDWRGYAIECLHLLDRNNEAIPIVAEYAALAEQWGTPRAVGRSLRAAAITVTGNRQIELLTESSEVLGASTSKLEWAQSLHALGDALRRAKRVREARDHLRTALEVAELCGATPLQQQIVKTMQLTGVRPGVATSHGVQSLTPGELRVAELAARGLSNRDIAQNLFITVKTVEVHLSNTFRKLQISGRHNLPGALDA